MIRGAAQLPCAPSRPCRRPLLLTTAGLAAVSLPLGLLKLVALRHSQWPHRQWPPFVALYAAHMAFAVAHVLVAQVGRERHSTVACAAARWLGLGLGWLGCNGTLAIQQPGGVAFHLWGAPTFLPWVQRVVDWARTRWEHGLGGWGFPWQVRCVRKTEPC